MRSLAEFVEASGHSILFFAKEFWNQISTKVRVFAKFDNANLFFFIDLIFTENVIQTTNCAIQFALENTE